MLIFHKIHISVQMRSQRPSKMSKDQKHDTHPCSNRSESSFQWLVPLTFVVLSVDTMFVLTTLITLIIVHFTSMFIFPLLSNFNLNIYARQLCKTISESILNVLRISNWLEIRAIYWHYFKTLDINIVYRWLLYPTSN